MLSVIELVRLTLIERSCLRSCFRSIPFGRHAIRVGLEPGKPLREQGYPDGIPIEFKQQKGADQ